ncbi:insertion sequence element IS200 transposase, partial [Salmonella enterica subsp. enterica serovar Heidelberg str. RI-11-013312]
TYIQIQEQGGSGAEGTYVDTVGKNTAKIQDYIKHQLEEDKMGEQLSIPYPGSPFTGRK